MIILKCLRKWLTYNSLLWLPLGLNTFHEIKWRTLMSEQLMRNMSINFGVYQIDVVAYANQINFETNHIRTLRRYFLVPAHKKSTTAARNFT